MASRTLKSRKERHGDGLENVLGKFFKVHGGIVKDLRRGSDNLRSEIQNPLRSLGFWSRL